MKSKHECISLLSLAGIVSKRRKRPMTSNERSHEATSAFPGEQDLLIPAS